MTKNQIVFYATAGDLGWLLSQLEVEKPLQYTLMGLFEVNEPQTYLSYRDIPDFGRASHPTAAANRSYLLSFKGLEVSVREIRQKVGGVLYGVDQIQNEDTIVLRPAGRYRDDIILCGMIGSVSKSEISKVLYDLAKKEFRKNFKKVREFFIGEEALHIWHAGARLTIGASSPTEFDLKHANIE